MEVLKNKLSFYIHNDNKMFIKYVYNTYNIDATIKKIIFNNYECYLEVGYGYDYGYVTTYFHFHFYDNYDSLDIQSYYDYNNKYESDNTVDGQYGRMIYKDYNIYNKGNIQILSLAHLFDEFKKIK